MDTALTILSAAAPVILGLVTRPLMDLVKRFIGVIDAWPDFVQQVVVLAVAGALVFGSGYVPGLADLVASMDPTLATAIATATAYAVHKPSPREAKDARTDNALTDDER